jgi:hypothetical protein
MGAALFRGERRVREQAVPVVRVVQAARPVRCGQPW